MSNLLERITAPRAPERSSLSFSDYLSLYTQSFIFGGHQYNVGPASGTRANTPDPTFEAYVRGIHEHNPIVSAAAIARGLLVSQIRFQWRNTYAANTPGRLFGTRDLAVLERPGRETRSDLLFGLELQASYAGNAYVVRRGDGLVRLRPDWVTVVLGSRTAGEGPLPSDAEVTGIIYQSRDGGQRGPVETFKPGEYAHWKPEPHPLDWWRGSSWVTSLVSEVTIDDQATRHTQAYFERAATPNLVYVMPDSLTADQVNEYADAMEARHSGASNAFKSMYLGGGADVKVVGSSLEQTGIRDLQGAAETRIAARSRVPAVVLQVREGMQGSALNSGNYSQTRRLWADGWFTPHAEGLCGALESIVPAPENAELSFDPSKILFLQEDQKDAAEIASTTAQAIRALTESGYEPSSVIDAVSTGDMSRLRHTGVFSVQLQPPTDGQSGTPQEPA